MDINGMRPELRKIYEDIDLLDFKVNMARENPDMYSEEELREMADIYPKKLAEVASILSSKFEQLPRDYQERIRKDVHENRDMTDVREWIEHVQDNVSWLMQRVSDSSDDETDAQ